MAYKKYTFLSLGKTIGVLEEVRPLVLQDEVHRGEISLLVGMDKYVVSVSKEEGRLIVWNMARPTQPKLLSEVKFGKGLEVTAVCHPDTYRNKVVVGFGNGKVQLWNVSSRKMIYEFANVGGSVVTIVQSTQLDVVAIGTEKGKIVLLHLKADEVINTFYCKGCAVRTIDFRNDGVDTMVVTTARGELIVWDLNEARICAKISDVHRKGASFARFLPGEAVLITAGVEDNAIKAHIFDGPTPAPRILRARAGHTLPPTKIGFGHNADLMVTAGLDCQVRLVSRLGNWRDTALSQAMVQRGGKRAKKSRKLRAGVESGSGGLDGGEVKLPPVTAMAVGNTRAMDEDFANVATCHVMKSAVYTWRTDGGGMHTNILLRSYGQQTSKVAATAVVITPSGNHALVGYADGALFKFSLQSGKCLDEFKRVKDGRRCIAHDRRLTSLAVSADGDVLLCASSADRKLRLWDVNRRQVINSILLPFHVLLLTVSQSSDLVAVALGDFSICIYDVATLKLVRKFDGHSGIITGMTFDKSGRRLISSAMDGTVKTWDMVAARCLDVMRCRNAPTAIALSPDGDNLVSTHVNEIGVTNWIDRSKFTSSAIGNIGFEHKLVSWNNAQNGDGGALRNKDELISLSNKPTTAWTTLANLEELKRRNQATEPIKKSEEAPFFLTSTRRIAQGLDMEVEDKQQQQTQPEQKKIDFSNTKFGTLALEGDMEGARKYIEALGPSAMDFEIRTINGLDAIEAVAKYFIERLGDRNTWELTQAQLGVFLSEHGLELAASPNGIEYLSSLQQRHDVAYASPLRQSIPSLHFSPVRGSTFRLLHCAQSPSKYPSLLSVLWSLLMRNKP